MSFLLILLLIAVVALAGVRLIRRDAQARPRAESYDRPAPKGR